MIDQICRYQDTAPADPEESLQKCSAGRISHLPNNWPHRLPLPKEQEQNQTCQQDIGTAFDRFGHEPGPGTFKPLTRHDAVLNCKKTKQQGIDDQCRGQRRIQYSSIDRLRNKDVADEPDGIEECKEKDQVANNPVKESKDST